MASPAAGLRPNTALTRPCGVKSTTVSEALVGGPDVVVRIDPDSVGEAPGVEPAADLADDGSVGTKLVELRCPALEIMSYPPDRRFPMGRSHGAPAGAGQPIKRLQVAFDRDHATCPEQTGGGDPDGAGHSRSAKHQHALAGRQPRAPRQGKPGVQTRISDGRSQTGSARSTRWG